MGQPLPSGQEDGVSQIHNSSRRGNMCRNGRSAGGRANKNDKCDTKPAKRKRGKRARIKRGMHGPGGSAARARRHRQNTSNLTNKGMNPDDLIRSLDQRKQRGKELTKTVMNELLEGAKEQDEAIKRERVATELRRTVMNTVVP